MYPFGQPARSVAGVRAVFITMIIIMMIISSTIITISIVIIISSSNTEWISEGSTQAWS